MVLAAIHGDETAPHLAADHFADMALKKGNLILIPRANLPSIMANKRLINHDMNRRFATTRAVTYEDEVVSVIKKYMHQSDIFLNLHEGGGFYRHTWEGPNHNPLKYGQCLIADADSLFIPEKDKVIRLKEIAEAVIHEINKHITVEEHLYRFNNHDTLNPRTSHAEQRRSASFYGLTQAHIPSYGVEVSRQLPSEALKKEYILLIVNEFMRYLDIQKAPTPVLHNPTPILHYLRVTIDGEKRYVEPNDIIYLDSGATLSVVDIVTNYARGNYASVVGLGNRNDISKSFRITRDTEIRVFHDSRTIARIPVRTKSDTRLVFDGFRVSILDDNTAHNVMIGDTLVVTEGAEIEIIGALNRDPAISITIAGATPRRRDGRLIVDTGAMDPRFAINHMRNLYEIVISENNKRVAQAYLRIRDIQAFGLHITHNGKEMVLAPGDTLITRYNDILYIHDVELNGLATDKVKVNFAGYIVHQHKEAEDRGGNIHLNSSGLIPRFAVNAARDTYEIHVLYKQKRYATYTVKIQK
jgi:hypothetical protein